MTDTQVVICRPALPIVEIRREHEKTAWCFTCRSRQGFVFIVRGFSDEDVKTLFTEIERGERPESDMWGLVSGGPFPSIECGSCATTDGDMGFGRYREWED